MIEFIDGVLLGMAVILVLLLIIDPTSLENCLENYPELAIDPLQPCTDSCNNLRLDFYSSDNDNCICYNRNTGQQIPIVVKE